MTTKSKTNSPTDRAKRNANKNSFLEALKELGDDFSKTAAQLPVGIAQEAVNQIFNRNAGELKPNQALNLKENQPQTFQADFLDIRRQEKIVWTGKQQETELQVQALIIELKKLALTTTKLAKEVQIAAVQAPVEAGSYHLTFFEKLRETILLFKQHIEQAACWLATSNQKAQKRSFYWAQVRKSGTKFMLSQERYMSTQAG